MRTLKIISYTPFFQALFFLLTALWPLFDIQSFEWVTGPKTDDWLVYTVSALILAIGVSLFVASYQPLLSPPAFCLGITSASALALIDIIFVAKHVISPVYLADAVVELGFVVAWFYNRPRKAIRGIAIASG